MLLEVVSLLSRIQKRKRPHLLHSGRTLKTQKKGTITEMLPFYDCITITYFAEKSLQSNLIALLDVTFMSAIEVPL